MPRTAPHRVDTLPPSSPLGPVVALGPQGVLGTQSFVYVLSAVWKRPALTFVEVVWRWVVGAPALWLAWRLLLRAVGLSHVDFRPLTAMSVFDPLGSVATIQTTVAALLPSLLHSVAWFIPAIGLAWAIASGAGRTLLLRRLDPRLHARPAALVGLQALRMAVLASTLVLWWICLRGAATVAVAEPVVHGREPNMVLFAALAVGATLLLFALWAAGSFALAMAPLLAMSCDVGPLTALRAAWSAHGLRLQLVEINLVMGIVKVALVVLALVLSSCPLPFESVATPGFLVWWYVFVGLLYCIASDMFHVVQLACSLELWRASQTARIGHGASGPAMPQAPAM